jgi:ribonuclease HI
VPWARARLRDQVVFARIDASGAFVSEGGRVEVRYKPNDGRAYRAAAGNLILVDAEILPDETCGSAEAAPTKEAAKAAAKKAAAAEATGPAGGPAGGYEVYADGACSGNPGPAGLGIHIRTPDGQAVDGYEYLGSATNNVAELTAILRALEIVPKDAVLTVRTDSQYAIGVLSKGWKAKANQELIATLKLAMKGREIHLRYVPGHAGVAGNERADELARCAVNERGSKMPAPLAP